jgi:hypothetical protein
MRPGDRYLDGKMEQFWRGPDGAGVVFLVIDWLEYAGKLLQALSHGGADLLKLELMPAATLTPLGMLSEKE